jgi:hypothetical protein
VLATVEPLFLDRRHQDPVFDQGGRGVAMEGVDPQDVHRRRVTEETMVGESA